MPLASLDIRNTVIQLLFYLTLLCLFVIRLEQPLDHMGHLILVLIVNHQHIMIVTPRLKPLEMLFLVVDQLGANVPNKVDQDILLHGLADVLVLAVE